MPNILWELLSYFNDMLALTHTHTHTHARTHARNHEGINPPRQRDSLMKVGVTNPFLTLSPAFRHRRVNKSTELKEEESEG